MKKKKSLISKLTIIGLLLSLIASNYIWYKMYKREEEKVKSALIPSLSNDYYTNQLALTKYTKETKN